MPYDPNEIRYAWYSPTADARQGHCVYLDMDGKEVLVTCVTRSPKDSNTLWPDIVLVGQVKNFVRAAWHKPIYGFKW